MGYTKSHPQMAIETTLELYTSLLSMGVPESALRNQSGLDIKKLRTPDQRIYVHQHLCLWDIGQNVLKLPDIGLRIGKMSNPFNRGIVGLVFAGSRNLEQAITNKIRFVRILADHIHMEFSQQDDYFSVNYSITEDCFSCYEIERVFAGFLNWIRHFVGKEVYPAQMFFQCSEKASIEQYKKHFQCPLTFNHRDNIICFPLELLSVTNQKHNDYLYRLLIKHAQNMLTNIQSNHLFVNKVRSLIASRLSTGDFSNTDIAAALKMSNRTLSRKLQQQGVSYKTILDEVRSKMASSYRSQPEICSKSIPYLLGYSEASAYNRALRRWASNDVT